MAGTSEGSKQSVAIIKAKDPDHYRKIALKAQEAWERNGRKPRGFSVASREQLSEWGKKGGSVSKRNRRKKV